MELNLSQFVNANELHLPQIPQVTFSNMNEQMGLTLEWNTYCTDEARVGGGFTSEDTEGHALFHLNPMCWNVSG